MYCSIKLHTDKNKQWTAFTKDYNTTNKLIRFLRRGRYIQPNSLTIKNSSGLDYQQIRFKFKKSVKGREIVNKWSTIDWQTTIIPSNYNNYIHATNNDALVSLKKMAKYAIKQITIPEHILTKTKYQILKPTQRP